MTHIRSEQLPTILLEQNDIDYAVGGLIDPAKSLDVSLEYVEIARREYDLISNFDFKERYGKSGPITHDFMRKQHVPLIIANVGVIVDCLLKSMGRPRDRNEDLRSQLAKIRGDETNAVCSYFPDLAGWPRFTNPGGPSREVLEHLEERPTWLVVGLTQCIAPRSTTSGVPAVSELAFIAAAEA